MTSPPDQFERLNEIEWDLLIILDACRWDYWQDMIGDGEPVWSGGNNTFEWIKAANRAMDFSETICITANPEVTRQTFEGLYFDRDDLWERAWEHVNGLGTVPPAAVTEAVRTRQTIGPERPIYAHYAQPHGPYPLHDPPVPVMRNNPHAAEVQTDVDYHPDEIIMDPTALLDDPEGWLTVEMLREAYRANLSWAWDAIQPLLGGDRTVVVTSDHGELLGERVEVETPDGLGELRYGHPSGAPLEPLRLVPLAVYE